MKLIPERLRRPPRDPEGRMTLVDHLTELRHRLVVSIVALAVGAAIGFWIFDAVVKLLTEPYCEYLETVPPGSRPTSACTLFFSGALEPALIKFKLSGFIGLFIALPVVLYQFWRFVVPGLRERERRLAIPFVLSSMGLFALGAAFAYWTLPRALEFLLGFAGSQFTALLTGERFLSFVMVVALSFGIAFEFPVALVFLILAGVLSTDRLREWRRYAILGIAIFAAVITPSSDPYTMLAMTIPMVLFYEGAIIIGRLMKR